MVNTNNVVPANPASFANASLYVGDLDYDVTEAMLYEVFNSVAMVASIRVCRDALTRRSLGYSYVNYNSVADAERALDTLNFTNIRGRPCRIMWSLRDPATRRNSEANVFVKNLDKSIDNKALYDTFSLFGNILSCKVATDSESQSLGYGFVHYEHPESAKEAVSRVHGIMIGSKVVYAGKFQRKCERTSQKDQYFTNLYIKNIPAEWIEDNLTDVFGQFGEITSVALRTDGKGRPFGFVNFKEGDSAKLAIEMLHNRVAMKDGGVIEDDEEGAAVAAAAAAAAASQDEENEDNFERKKSYEENDEDRNECGHDGKLNGSDDLNGSTSRGEEEQSNRLYVCRAQKKGERQSLLRAQHEGAQDVRQRFQGVNLYIKNLSEGISDMELRSLFEPFGTITSSHVKLDDRGNSRGFGFVCFVSPDEATKAIAEMHLKLVKGKPLYVGLHERREQRTARLQQRLRMPAGGMPAGGLPAVPPQMQFGAPPQMYFPGNPGMQPHPRAPMMPFTASQGVVGTGPWRGPQNRAPYGQSSNNMGGQVTGNMNSYSGMPLQGISGGVPHGQNVGSNMRPQRINRGLSANQKQQGISAQKHNLKVNSQGRYNNRIDGQIPPHNMGQQSLQGDLGGLNTDMTLTASTLASASPSMQKQLLGEKLFPIVTKFQPELAGKITGMMLEMDNSELLDILSSESEVKSKVEEALLVLQRAQTAA